MLSARCLFCPYSNQQLCISCVLGNLLQPPAPLASKPYILLHNTPHLAGKQAQPYHVACAMLSARISAFHLVMGSSTAHSLQLSQTAFSTCAGATYPTDTTLYVLPDTDNATATIEVTGVHSRLAVCFLQKEACPAHAWRPVLTFIQLHSAHCISS